MIIVKGNKIYIDNANMFYPERLYLIRVCADHKQAKRIAKDLSELHNNEEMQFEK